ncbi:MAG: type 1 glutamine amidotransferase [Planctomycetota bacterium]
MPIYVLQHDSVNRPGRLGMTLRDHGFDQEVLRLDEGESLPSDFDDVDGVISLGGPQQVDEKHAWIQPELDFLGGAHERSLPVVGVCLGAQLIAKALGGEVGAMTEPELGFDDVTINARSHTETLLSGIAWTSPQFHFHSYEVREAPPGARVLASSRRCAVQAFAVGMRTYAFQYHIEADRSIIDDLTGDAKTQLHASGLTSEEFAHQLDEKYPAFARLADRLCVNIATYLIPRVANAIQR